MCCLLLILCVEFEAFSGFEFYLILCWCIYVLLHLCVLLFGYWAAMFAYGSLCLVFCYLLLHVVPGLGCCFLWVTEGVLLFAGLLVLRVELGLFEVCLLLACGLGWIYGCWLIFRGCCFGFFMCLGLC